MVKAGLILIYIHIVQGRFTKTEKKEKTWICRMRWLNLSNNILWSCHHLSVQNKEGKHVWGSIKGFLQLSRYYAKRRRQLWALYRCINLIRKYRFFETDVTACLITDDYRGLIGSEPHNPCSRSNQPACHCISLRVSFGINSQEISVVHQKTSFRFPTVNLWFLRLWKRWKTEIE